MFRINVFYQHFACYSEDIYSLSRNRNSIVHLTFVIVNKRVILY